eukprot:5291518-Prymnesium_polylepis.1
MSTGPIEPISSVICIAVALRLIREGFEHDPPSTMRRVHRSSYGLYELVCTLSTPIRADLELEQ